MLKNYSDNNNYRLRAYEIKRILASKHTKDFYATEVKTGASYGGDFLQFDGFAIKKSWVNLKYTGYEIKTARGDFLQDEKWRGYLPYCNEFYWVCPKDLIKKDEISEECGLIYIYPDSHVTRVVKKPQYRNIEHPIDLLLYLIMWQVNPPKYPFFNDNVEYFKAWLENKKDNQDLGYRVSKKLREEIENTRRISKENEQLKLNIQKHEMLIKVLQKHNLYSAYFHHINIDELDHRLSGKAPSDTVKLVDNIIYNAARLKESFEENTKENNDGK